MPPVGGFDVTLPRVRLASLPTPLERAERLEDALAPEIRQTPRIYLKRDDLLSLGMGGNKVRNLEFSLGAALAAGATDIVTAGRLQSNHCRLTAAACARAGLQAHLVFSGTQPQSPSGNLLLDRLFGAAWYFTNSADTSLRQPLVDDVAARLKREGRTPYVLPVGGSDATGAVGHALAAAELRQQLEEVDAGSTHVVLATATGGTQAGMLAGFRRCGADVPITGFAVARSADQLSATVAAIARDVGETLGIRSFAPDVDVRGDALGDGYGVPTTAGAEAMRLLARTEGVVLDPTYTGKAFAGLLAMLREGLLRDSEVVVFIHTGGAPALFAVTADTEM